MTRIPAVMEFFGDYGVIFYINNFSDFSFVVELQSRLA